MGYSEMMCQLCGVGFAIVGYRCPDEPSEAAWDYSGRGFHENPSFTANSYECVSCDNENIGDAPESETRRSGNDACRRVCRPGADDKEHLAGPDCKGALRSQVGGSPSMR